MGWQKALPEEDVRVAVATYLQAYVDQVRQYVKARRTRASRCVSTTPTARSMRCCWRPACRRVIDLLDDMTEVVDNERRFVRAPGCAS